MKMVIGGAYQGKTDYAKQVYPNLVWSDWETDIDIVTGKQIGRAHV